MPATWSATSVPAYGSSPRVGEAGDALGHHPRVTMGDRYVDLKLISDDAIYRDDKGTEHVVEWVTQQDLELARRITEVAAEQAADADPASITAIELALDTAHAATIAPVWAALLTGSTEAQGRGTIDEDVRDATGRVPILWFQDTDEHEIPRQRFHIDVQVPYDVADQRIAAAVAAGAVIVDDSRAPWTTVLADQDGNRACVGTMQQPPAKWQRPVRRQRGEAGCACGAVRARLIHVVRGRHRLPR
jgi:4a-hydroxytetrahydrobiopterin dehydratase